MKKILIVFTVAGLMIACNNGGDSKDGSDSIEQKVDSLEEREDTLKNMVDSTFEAKKDSLDQRKQELKEKFDSTIEAKKRFDKKTFIKA